MILQFVEALTTAEPVTLAEAKMHLRVDHDDEDAYILGRIAAAREECEKINRRAWRSEAWIGRLMQWPDEPFLRITKGPLQSVTGISYLCDDGTERVMTPADYVVDAASEPGRVWLVNDRAWPGERLQAGPSIIVRFVAGYTSVGERYKQALLLILGSFYENREDVVMQSGIQAVKAPRAADAILKMNRGNY